MIGSLRGTVIERRPVGDTAVEIVLDVGGVGYRVHVSPRLAGSFGTIGVKGIDGGGPQAALSIHTHVREGAITLYGFADADERRAFELLLGAHGVGPSLALAIVSMHGPDRLVEIVASDDIDALTLVPGVGRKTAVRLLVDLKSRFGELDGALPSAVRLIGGTPPASNEVADALAQLGYGPDEIRAAVRALPAEGTLEELLRAALRELAPRR
ncbi:MAG TPA: Holliday junction branch migration protein RuvA [Acidimicrobiales bacterium]|nr:Holliday junction branch migration protein RuvA [Acidimicrobiales bacterium]